MILLRQALGKLIAGKDGRVDLPSDSLLHHSQLRTDIHRAQTAYEHKIDVAGGPLFSAGHRAVDKANLESLRGGDRFAQHRDNTACLLNQPVQLWINRGILIGLDVGSAAIHTLFEYPHAHESVDLPLQGRGASPEGSGQFAQVPIFLGPEEERGQDGLASGADDGRESGILTHIASIITHIT